MAKTISARKKKELEARVLEVQKAQPAPLGTRRSAMIPIEVLPIEEPLPIVDRSYYSSQVQEALLGNMREYKQRDFPKGFSHNIPGFNKNF